MAVSFGQLILWFVQQLNQFEVNGTKLPRAHCAKIRVETSP